MNRLLTLSCLLLTGMAATVAHGGEFTVNPIRLELDKTTKSSAITVKNEDPEKISFQVKAMEWTQDANGKDQYTDTQELVYFPKVMTTEPGEARVIRIGTKFPLIPKEKTYRLFIEELPPAPKTNDGKKAQVNVLIRFGAPIFVKPAKAEHSAEIEEIALNKGELTLRARNTGNEHLVIEGIHLKGMNSAGNEVYALTLADRYLLAGAAKPYSATLSKEQCAKLVVLAIEFKSDKVTLQRRLEVNATMCH